MDTDQSTTLPPAEPATPNRPLALCLSGGGFRATLFHLGALRRLNELGVLASVDIITSVSGGSILNGVLATQWSGLTRDANNCFTNFDALVGERVRDFCKRDLRTKLVFGTRANPINWPRLARDMLSVSASFLAKAYQNLLESRRLEELPDAPNAPRFIFCATSVQSGACWHFHGGPNARMGDFYTGYCDAKHVPVSDAVAASSAFPPGFAALRLTLPRNVELTRVDQWGKERAPSPKRPSIASGIGRTIVLTDGGVYDNLGVEPVWDRCKALFVSDAGHPFSSLPNVRQWIVPRLVRAADISAEQVGAVRKRWLVEMLIDRRRVGALWSINSPPTRFTAKHNRLYGYSASSRTFGPT